MSETYGEKCHRCAHLRHDGETRSEPVPWLRKPPDRLLWCDDCDFCQHDSLHVLIVANGGLDLFSPEVREAVKAFHDGTDHPLIDALREECQALEQTIEFMGQRWSVADAQRDRDEATGSLHWHLTLTPLGGDLIPATQSAAPSKFGRSGE